MAVWRVRASWGIPDMQAAPASMAAALIFMKVRHPIHNPHMHGANIFLTDGSAKNYDVPVQGFRYFNVYGPHEGHKQTWPAQCINSPNRHKNGVIRLFENSNIYSRDFVFVGDLCRMHEAMAKPVSGVNAGTGTAVSFAALAEAIAQKHQARIDLIPMPEALKGQYQEFTQANISALASHVDLRWIDVRDYIAGTD